MGNSTITFHFSRGREGRIGGKPTSAVCLTGLRWTVNFAWFCSHWFIIRSPGPVPQVEAGVVTRVSGNKSTFVVYKNHVRRRRETAFLENPYCSFPSHKDVHKRCFFLPEYESRFSPREARFSIDWMRERFESLQSQGSSFWHPREPKGHVWGQKFESWRKILGRWQRTQGSAMPTKFCNISKWVKCEKIIRFWSHQRLCPGIVSEILRSRGHVGVLSVQGEEAVWTVGQESHAEPLSLQGTPAPL